MEDEEFIEKCADDVGFFAHNILYKQRKCLSAKQLELVNAMKTEQHTAAIFNRQGGKTEVFAVYNVHELCFGRTSTDEPIHIMVYAPILDQTEIIMRRIHSFFNNISLLEGFKRERNKFNIEMNNGNTLRLL